MATFKKRLGSGSTQGKLVKIVATSTPGTTIHQAVAGTTDGTYDEIYIWAINNHTGDVTISVEWGGVVSPDDLIITTIPTKVGAYPVIPGWILQNELYVKAFASVANVVMLNVFVNRIMD
jgi:hypothetical protein